MTQDEFFYEQAVKLARTAFNATEESEAYVQGIIDPVLHKKAEDDCRRISIMGGF